jgi:hypothetical protein
MFTTLTSEQHSFMSLKGGEKALLGEGSQKALEKNQSEYSGL